MPQKKPSAYISAPAPIINYKQRAKKRRLQRRIMSFMFLIICMLCVAFWAPFFNIKTVTILGNNRLSNEQVFEASGITLGQNIFWLNTHEVGLKIADVPYVEKISVRRGFPNIIKLDILECIPISYVQLEDGYLLVSTQGKVLAKVAALPSAQIIRITGIAVDEQSIGQYIAPDDSALLKSYIAITQQILQNNLSTQVHLVDLSGAIDFTDESCVFLHINKLIVTLKANDSAKMEYKFNSLISIFETSGYNIKGHLDMTRSNEFNFRESVD